MCFKSLRLIEEKTLFQKFLRLNEKINTCTHLEKHMSETVIRRKYLHKLKQYRKLDTIKVVTGMRRTGKTVIMEQFRQILLEEGVPMEDILYIDMESLKNRRYADGMKLYDEIMERFNGRKLYILIDEVQFITGWERVVNSLKKDIDCDIYLSGSNAYLLSNDISTLLTGRNTSMTVLPMSLPELVELGMGDDPNDAFMTYLSFGALPVLRPFHSGDNRLKRIEDIKSDIILKDICNRKEKIDSVKVRKVIDYLFSEIGNQISVEKISQQLNISTSTASEYLNLIKESMLFIQAERYDLKGKKILKSQPKFYCTDIGMRATQPFPSENDFGRKLENTVFLELLRRDKHVYIGNIGNYEVDFITIDEGVVEYYQVSQTIIDPSTKERELRPFRHISGPGERILITYDNVPKYREEGVTIINIVDFLMEQDTTMITEGPVHDAHRNILQKFEEFIQICSDIMDTVITQSIFDEMSKDEQMSFFDLQFAFRDPSVTDNMEIQNILTEVRKTSVQIFHSMMACANSNIGGGTNRPVNNGEIQRLRNLYNRTFDLLRER